jgi:nonsense-mediated mRNA decay protein 3
MQRKFCFVCGKQSTIEGQCEECWGKKHPLAELPDKIEFIQCPKCNLVLSKGKWIQPNYERIVEHSAKLHGEVTAWEITPVKNMYEVIAHGEVSGVRKDEKHVVRLHAVRNICPVCGKLLSGYYEARLQLRGSNVGAMAVWLEKEAERIGKKDSTAFYRHELFKEGVDFLFGSKAVAKGIAEGLRKRFNAELTTSFQIAGRKDGKELRRTIISIRSGQNA